jgi:hypothetical protein
VTGRGAGVPFDRISKARGAGVPFEFPTEFPFFSLFYFILFYFIFLFKIGSSDEDTRARVATAVSEFILFYFILIFNLK